jgi:hypothetical protein
MDNFRKRVTARLGGCEPKKSAQTGDIIVGRRRPAKRLTK